MELRLALRGEDPTGESRSLLDWLRVEAMPGVRVSLEHGMASPGEMGMVDDILRLVCDPKAAAAVAGAIGTWITTRRRAVEINLKKGDRELTLTAGSPRDARKVMGDIQQLLESPSDPRAGDPNEVG